MHRPLQVVAAVMTWTQIMTEEEGTSCDAWRTLVSSSTARYLGFVPYHYLYALYTQWSFHELPCAASQLHDFSALQPVLPLVLSPEEVTLAVTVTRLPAATSHGNHLTMPLPIQLDRH
jgi:hypothetical protein